MSGVEVTPFESETPDQALEFVCVECSFPVVAQHDETGRLIGYKQEATPTTEEEALNAGWTDHGMGMVCPSCSLSHLEDLVRQEDTETAALDFDEFLDAQVMRALAPAVGDATIQEFVKVFKTERLNKLRIKMGLEGIPGYIPVPKDEEQAKEFLALTAALENAKKPRKAPRKGRKKKST
jgi:hypothetical protein